MNWRSFVQFLFTERLGYRRPSGLTDRDHQLRFDQIEQRARIDQEIEILDAARDLFLRGDDRKPEVSS